MTDKEKKFWNIVIMASILFLIAVTFIYFKNFKNETVSADIKENVSPKQLQQFTVIKPKRQLSSVSMDKMKTQGCVADGLLSEYNPENDKFISLINRSNCYYLHRAIETWLTPPDFEKAQGVIDQITKPNVVYGMFIAEAISLRKDFVDQDTGHGFDFKKMCRDGSTNVWGEGTCKPTFSSKEYRNYIKYITEKAIDTGVQSFTFGQIYMQEGGDKDYAPKIVQDIRDYAKEKGIDVVIGAQTGSITDPNYLKLFDYIEGGVGIDEKGNVEDGPCFSKRGSCWALLWNKQFSQNANNVLLALDWTGIPSDDLDIFARMDQQKRSQTLHNLYKKFTAQNMGFLMPYFGVLDNENGGCRGPKRKFYSPDNSYSCKDEDIITAILQGKNANMSISNETNSQPIL